MGRLWKLTSRQALMGWLWLTCHVLFAADPIGGRVVDLTLSLDSRWLAIADRDHRVDLLDAKTGTRVARWDGMTGSVHSVAWLPNSDGLLVTHPQERLIRHLTWREGVLHETRREAVGAEPAQMLVTGSAAWSVFPWEHSVRIGPLATDALTVPRSVPLDLIPGKLLRLPDDRCLILDAFQSQYALVEERSGALLATGTLQGHSLYGATVVGDRLWIAHQLLNEATALTADNIRQGRVLSNRLTAWSLASLATGQPQVDCVISLDAPPLGAGDPSDVVAIDGGMLVVALAGVNQLAVVDVAQQRVTSRIAIGRRPLRLVRTAPDQIAVLLAGEQAVVSISLPAGELRWRTDLGAHAVSTPQRRGEDAFYDARLSAGGFLSCHSCHTDGHTHGLLADTFNDGSHGTPKRTPTLRGTALTYRWAWNGQFQNLHDQVRVSFLETQHAPELEETTVLDVVSFLHTLPFTRPRRTTWTSRADERLQSRGQQLFERLQCTQCHIPPVIYAAHEMFDVGLADERGLVKFNPPSLRGIGHQRRFFHDNRAGSLADVFREFAHPGATRLNEEDLAALVRFLESL